MDAAVPTDDAQESVDAGVSDVRFYVDARRRETDAATRRDAALPCEGPVELRRVHRSPVAYTGGAETRAIFSGRSLALLFSEPAAGALDWRFGWVADVDTDEAVVSGGETGVLVSSLAGEPLLVGPAGYAVVGPDGPHDWREHASDVSAGAWLPGTVCADGRSVGVALCNEGRYGVRIGVFPSAADGLVLSEPLVPGDGAWGTCEPGSGRLELSCVRSAGSTTAFVWVGREPTGPAPTDIHAVRWDSEGRRSGSPIAFGVPGGFESVLPFDAGGAGVFLFAFTAFSADRGGPGVRAFHVVGEAVVPAGETVLPAWAGSARPHGVLDIGGEPMLVYTAGNLQLVAYEPATGAFGEAVIVGDAPCDFGWMPAATLSTGVYLPLDCGREKWLLHMCGGGP